MWELTRFIILSAAVYRITRFIIMDSLWDDTRNRFLDWLTTGTNAFGERAPIDNKLDPEHWRQLNFYKRKTAELMGCPWCVTVWVAAAVVLLTWLFSEDLPIPWFYWPALSAGGLTFWAIIDSD